MVSVAACMVAATILELLVGTAGFSPLAAQPAAVIAATPLSFLGSKKWSFAEPAPAAPMRAAAPRNTWLIVPTYNEAENLEPFVRQVLPQLASAAGEHRVLMVDDSSPDGTGEIADRLAAELDAVEVLHRAEKDGLGRAYAAGFERALAEGAELVMQMDVDFSHDPKHIPALIAAADGRRPGDRVALRRRRRRDRLGPRRRLLSRGGSWYARTVLRVPVKDLTGGFKCFRRELLERLSTASFDTAGFGFQVETTYRAVRGGARVHEVPIRFRDREAGDIEDELADRRRGALAGAGAQAARRAPGVRLVARDEVGDGGDLVVGELAAEGRHPAAAVAHDPLDRAGVERDVVEVGAGGPRRAGGGERVTAAAGVGEDGLAVDGRRASSLAVAPRLAAAAASSASGLSSAITCGPTNSMIAKNTTSDQASTSRTESIRAASAQMAGQPPLSMNQRALVSQTPTSTANRTPPATGSARPGSPFEFTIVTLAANAP